MPKTTRRSILCSSFGAVAGFFGTRAVRATQQEGAQWDIGLPLHPEWSTSLNGDLFPVRATSNHKLIVRRAKEISDNEELYLIDIETGEVERIASITGGVFDVAVSSETILLSLRDEVLALDTDGSELWRDSTQNNAPYFITSYPDGFVYIGATARVTDRGGEQVVYYDEAQMVAISTKGNRHFIKNVGFISGFAILEDRIIARVTSEIKTEDGYKVTDGHIACFDFDGTERWQIDTDPPKRVYVRDSQAIVSTTNDTFEIIEIPSGNRLDIYENEGSFLDFAVGDGRIYYQPNTQLRAINLQDGSEEWSVDTGNGIFDITFGEDALYTGWNSGRFDMRRPSDGKIIWEHSRTSKSDSGGYERIIDGRLLTFYGDTIECFIGRKGEAVDKYRQLTTPEGVAIGPRLNQLISGGKLADAENAIEDGRYQAAIQALDDARWRLTAIDSALGMTVLGSIYTGSRKSVSTIRRRLFERKADKFQAAYPISEGGLEGLAPREIMSQIEVAVESQDTGLLGDPIRAALEDDTSQEQLEATISRYVETAPQLNRLSRRLATFDPSDDIRQRWAEEIRTCINEPDTVAKRCEKINGLLDQYRTWKQYGEPTFKFAGERFDTDAVYMAFRATGGRGASDDSAVRTYIDAATEFVTAASKNGGTLSGYDLSAITDVSRRALNTDQSSYSGAAKSLTQTAEMLRSAAEAEETRQSLSLEHTDESKLGIKERLQEAISDLHLSGVQELNQYVQNLAAGAWRLDHISSLSPAEFENLIGEFYTAQGYSAEVTQQSADRGIDVLAQGGGETLAIQAKRYTGSNKVGRPAIQKIVGAATQTDADRAVVVTTSGFTKAAKSAAREFGDQVEIIDGENLVRLLTDSPLAPPQSSNSRGSDTSTSSTSSERDKQRTSQSQKKSQQARCDACGEVFQGGLSKVTLPDGTTGYCCPRCEQIINESIGHTETDVREAASVLGVSPNASQEIIEDAYRKRVKECHPDTSDGNREEFLRVQEAYQKLS